MYALLCSIPIRIIHIVVQMGYGWVKPPEAALPWNETLDATKFNRRCPTSSADSTDEPSDAFDTGPLEDCLHINVYTPQLGTNNASGFPVLFYIHGGSFRVGSARDFRPEFLVDRDVVLVVPQYRLGPLGFLSLQTEDIPGNVGLLDILLALHWVKDHIHLFGGDPSKVTILGQSAGGAAVTLLMVSPRVQEGNTLEGCTKDIQYVIRSKNTSVEIAESPTTIEDALQHALLSNSSNKSSFIDLLADELRSASNYVFQAPADADTMILNRAVNLSLEDLRSVVVVVVLLIAISDQTSYVGFVVPGSQMRQRKIFNSKNLQQALGDMMGNILFLYEITGCDTTSSMFKKGKRTDSFEYSDLKRGGRGTGGNHVVIQSEAVGEASMFLREDPGISLKEGRFVRVPLMGGITKHEGSFILGNIYDIILQTKKLTNDFDYLSHNLTRDTLDFGGIEDPTGLVVQTLTEKYFGHGELGNFSKMTPGLVDICGVSLLKASALRTVLENSRVQPSYLYSFNYDGQFTMFGYGEEVDYPFPGGVAHSDDLIYLFPHHDKNLSDAELAVANTMVDLWTNFAATGSPAPAAGVESWPPVSGERGPYLRIDRKSTVRENFLDEYVIAVTDGFQFSSSPASFRSFYTLFTIAISYVVHLLP
uniref:Carboxylic ester hydrolase n=1 Tax=Timema poppense TaxID=170557 RepID=A0A7R9H0R2_TIMPO|nr:unnamed protein product [Timema poppensis]